MKKLLIVLMVLGLTSCKSGIGSGQDSVNYKFENNVLYYKGNQIGHVEAIKLQEKGGLIRREVVIVMNNETELYHQAIDIIKYMRFHNKNSDIELKLIIN